MITVKGARDVDLEHALRLGIPFAPYGGIVWDGDHFAYTNVRERIDELDTITGSVYAVRDDKGRLKTIFHTFTRPILINGRREIRTWRHRYDYAYADHPALPQGFPVRIDQFVLMADGSEFYNSRITFFRLILSKEPLAESLLAFEPIVGPHPLLQWVTTNDVELVFDGKRWNPVPSPAIFLTPSHRPIQPLKRFFVWVMLLTPTILLALFWARRKKLAAKH